MLYSIYPSINILISFSSPFDVKTITNSDIYTPNLYGKIINEQGEILNFELLLSPNSNFENDLKTGYCEKWYKFKLNTQFGKENLISLDKLSLDFKKGKVIQLYADYMEKN